MQIYAGFIMTYNRSHIIVDTITKLFSQTHPPVKLLIVDNSEGDDTKIVIENLRDNRLEYYKVGYNSGPAGAACIGLKKLQQEGYEWIYWGDDGDPPNFPNTMQGLFEVVNSGVSNIGIIGEVGQYFNFKRGVIERVPDSDLLNVLALPVISVAGNQSMLINASVIKKGILPDERLFFGLEELDFCLSAHNAGFRILVHAQNMLLARKRYSKLNWTNPIYEYKNNLEREYYSVRNKLFILKKNGLVGAFCFQFLKECLKSIYGFRFGLKYGWLHFNMVARGILHSMTLQMGKIFSV